MIIYGFNEYLNVNKMKIENNHFVFSLVSDQRIWIMSVMLMLMIG